MDLTRLITNDTNENHLKVIGGLIERAHEIKIATAFLKVSGLEEILTVLKQAVKGSIPITIIAGQHFGLTDPNALSTLYKLHRKYPCLNVFLDRAASPTAVFHPKLFLFRLKKKGVMISGSANITSGGLQNNTEVSVLHETNLSSDVWQQSLAYFNRLCSPEASERLSLMAIRRYSHFHDRQSSRRHKELIVPDQSFAFDYDRLKAHLEAYKRGSARNDFAKRMGYYQKALVILDKIVDAPRLSQKQFEEHIDVLVGKKGELGFWHSGSLFRHRRSVYKHKKEFRVLVKYIREHKEKPLSEVFVGAKWRVGKINGAAVNYITEIMMTHRPDRFANLNSNPIKVLKKEAGVYFKSHSSSFNGKDYEAYCELLVEMADRLELRNMLEVDSFFNYIYWKIKE